ncbi:MAG: M56 family metallopeptidase, partial [Gammaproteobacteria bacterium]
MFSEAVGGLAPLINNLGWTLLHFLWQGLAGALVFALLMQLLGKRSATARYTVGLTVFTATAFLPVVTFLTMETTTGPVGGITAVTITAAGAVVTDFWSRVPAMIEPLLPLAVGAWFSGVLMLSLRLAGDWRWVHHLRTTEVWELPEHCAAIVENLCTRLGLTKPVPTVVSAAVPCPTVIGWLRPMILIPASTLVGLTPQQLEMIITHEIAHIRRHDFVINLFQVCVETVLFYHPAVRWMSGQIRSEREHCCDDYVVASSYDATSYARALAELEQARSLPAQFAVAASGGSLVRRIHRLIDDCSSAGGSAVVATGLMIAALILIGLAVIPFDAPESHNVDNVKPIAI